MAADEEGRGGSVNCSHLRRLQLLPSWRSMRVLQGSKPDGVGAVLAEDDGGELNPWSRWLAWKKRRGAAAQGDPATGGGQGRDRPWAPD
jgi:hypothetical protein